MVEALRREHLAWAVVWTDPERARDLASQALDLNRPVDLSRRPPSPMSARGKRGRARAARRHILALIDENDTHVYLRDVAAANGGYPGR